MACTRVVGTEEQQRTPAATTLSPIARAPRSPMASPSLEPPPRVEFPTAPIAGALEGSSLHDPMPGGFLGGWWGDTGIDIAGDHLDVYAIASGTLDYAEWGHTRWRRKPDTAFSVRLRFDEPILWDDGHRVTHAYYTHLSKVENEVKEGAAMRKHVVAGERIGVSGIGNGTPHLHLGLLLDDQVEQDSWTYILREDAIRKLMGRMRNGARLPLAHRPR